MSTLREQANYWGILLRMEDVELTTVERREIAVLLDAAAAALERQGENEQHMRNLGSIADMLYGPDTSPQGER